jgi:hypothetical protein
MQRIAYITNGFITNVSLAKDDYILQDNEMIETDALAAGFSYYQPPIGPKKWENVQAFMGEFTMQQKAAIALSVDPTVAALRLELTTWFSEVHADDPRVQAGLDKLVELGIITESRKEQIVTP